MLLSSHPILRELSDQELALCQRVEALNATGKNPQWQPDLQAIGEEYLELHRDYWQLASAAPEAAVRLEALKRLLFLSFCALAEPDLYTGVAVDPDVMRQSFTLLESYLTGQQVDAELQWMLASYAPWLGLLPAYGFDLPALEAFTAAVDPSELHQPDRELPPRTMDYRGQMGLYWRSRAVERPAA